MSCENLKKKRKKKKDLTYAFCKSGALQFGIRAVCSEDLRLDLSIGWKQKEL